MTPTCEWAPCVKYGGPSELAFLFLEKPEKARSGRSPVRPASLTKDEDMNILTFTEARAGLKQALDSVCRDHEPTVITRQRGDHVVILSLEDYNSMQETLHLLGSPTNAERLRRSIADLKAGKTPHEGLLNDAAEEGKKQGSRKK